MVERYRPKVTATLTHDGPGRTPPGPLAVGDYIEANLDDSKVGPGYRFYLVTRVYPRKRMVRLFYAPTLSAFDYSADTLARNPTVKKLDDRYATRLAKRIKERRKEYKSYGARLTKDVDEALALLRA